MRIFLLLFVATFILFIHTYVCMEIIGGREATPHSRPHMACITTGNKLCDGALIDSSWVLTAAHCTIDISTTIKLGAHSLKAEDQYVQNFKVLKWLKHCYNANTLDNDIQLVQLFGKAKLNEAVKPLELPTTFCDVEPGTICEVAGWGRTSNDDVYRPPDKLMEVSLPAISREQCVAMWYPYAITKNMMCTLYANGGKGDCRGDSGGPLICQGEFRGIVSFGPKACAIPSRPDVYAFLTEDHVTWIKKQIEKKTE
ncbi:granzyme A-like isoform X1 [Hyperolius riggenbachi]|uniref:granzyme A-like isoform X1 n=1 Tax=Hyperolius riggenbachi TaxID=752182 RepID=UPI0035A3994D